MTRDKGIQYDRSLLGVETYLGTFQVTKEMILDFARSSGDLNSLSDKRIKSNIKMYNTTTFSLQNPIIFVSKINFEHFYEIILDPFLTLHKNKS